MSTKSIKFYKYSIHIEGDEYFSSLKDIKDDEKPHIDNKNVNVNLLSGESFSERFHTIYIKLGDATHYSDEVVDTENNLEIKENPRKKTEIELDNQFLLLIDKNNKTIYLSKGSEKYRTFAEERLSDKTKHTIFIKQILNKKSFEDSLSTISEVNICFENLDLFNREDSLSIRLDEDKLHYEANSIMVTFKYKHKKPFGGLKKKMSKWMNNPDFEGRIVGKDVNGLESIFQPDAILSVLEVKIDAEEKNKKPDYKTILKALIDKIQSKESKEHE